MPRALVLYAHPCPESFSAALHRSVIEGLSPRWHVDDFDLYAEGFSPLMTQAERRIYYDEPANIDPVSDHVARVKAADALVLVFPVWNFGYPAILKGFFDRVFLPGVSFNIVDGKVQPNLHNIRKLAAVTSYGGGRLRALLAGDPPRCCVTRHLRYVCHRDAKPKYLALYGINRATDSDRSKFLKRVQTEMAAF